MLKEHTTKVGTWLEKISEDSKKGLRVIHKIIEVDGKKRFKLDGFSGTGQHLRGTSQEMSLKDVYNVPYNEA